MSAIFGIDLAGRAYAVSISSRDFYVLANKTLLAVIAGPAWCEACETFVPGEIIPTAAELDERLKELEYFAQRPGLIPPDRHLCFSQIPDLKVRQKWRATRIQPAKCLTCGSTALTLIWLGTQVEIPGRGKCIARFRGWADKYEVEKHYTSEGDLV